MLIGCPAAPHQARSSAGDFTPIDDAQPVSNPHWLLADTTARLDGPPLAAEVDLHKPQYGLHHLSWLGMGVPSDEPRLMLGVGDPAYSPDERHEPALAESYARGDDLVATYPQTEARPYRMQAYWRICPRPAGVIFQVELQVSLNTSLLDTSPTVAVVSCLDAGPCVQVEASVGSFHIVRPDGADWSLVHMIHPVDQTHPTAIALPPGGVELRTPLFGKFLEKGVILRARARAALLKRQGDEAAALALYEEFRHAPLPLTT